MHTTASMTSHSSHTEVAREMPEMQDLVARLNSQVERLGHLNGRLVAARERLGAGMPHEVGEGGKSAATPADICGALRLLHSHFVGELELLERTATEIERIV